MGTCASIDKNPESAVRFRLVVGTKKVCAPPPGGRGLAAGGFDQKGRLADTSPGFRSPGFGSKDETFFDSRAWLESDCEDDFFSVNGDFTPSRGSTPNHQIGTATRPQLNNVLQPVWASTLEGFRDTQSEPSPRKKLAEFFKESSSEFAELESKFVETSKEASTDQIQKPLAVDPCFPQTDSSAGGRVSKNGFTNEVEDREKSMQCCLLSLVPSHFIERKKQGRSPEPHISG